MQQQVVVGGCNDWLSELGSATMASLASLGGCENWLGELGSTTTASLAGLTVYVEATGSETRNRVRGYGHGVTPEMVSYASSSTANSSRKSSTVGRGTSSASAITDLATADKPATSTDKPADDDATTKIIDDADDTFAAATTKPSGNTAFGPQSAIPFSISYPSDAFAAAHVLHAVATISNVGISTIDAISR
ncbi:hypothetical protein D8674_038225 [Pyrus ussuriensis x Pyrus communis]|uniref:Uncharacterized protein n=1 Tax=Pyrus ussuriensis x Pyrus communis TaxID=2448454 RepID=A0A5N5I286_9ROSA|nr:hypothetical protein D8674_038225 [Pyrus ussuriensis x Pyrus communis]